MLDKKFLLICIVLINTYRELFSSIPIDLTQKKFATPTLTPITPKSVYRPHNHILG